MAMQTIQLGASPTGVGGDTPRSANVKINANFNELYTYPAYYASRALSGAQYGAGQGGYTGWNDGNDGSGFNGQMAFTCNRGGGSGGFSWRSVVSDNSAGGPVMTYAYDGTLNIPYRLTLGGRDVVTRGTNANGTYVRYADGTQICYKTISTNSTNTYQVGSLWGSDAVGGSWAAAFVERPWVSVGSSSISGSQGRWPSCFTDWGTASCGLWRGLATDNASAVLSISLIAVGRWF